MGVLSVELREITLHTVSDSSKKCNKYDDVELPDKMDTDVQRNHNATSTDDITFGMVGTWCSSVKVYG